MAEAALPERSTRIEHLFVPAEFLPHADGSRSRADPLLSPTGQRENSTTQERPASRCLFSTCFKLIIGYTLVINFNSFEIFSCLSQRGKSKKMAVKCSIIKRDKVYYFHFQKIDGKYTQRAIKNVDTLSKRKNGISSSYPDLLDPSFGSCLKRVSPKEGKKNGGVYLCESKLILYFCKSLIAKYLHKDTWITVQKIVHFCTKILPIYQRKIPGHSNIIVYP
ncbi:hypothetical protein [uncultured Victivallis sp.]|uniref:hypothetical protein n=1 Tax=uncultured Victivallis sp. TaxID=354118 RepID=UPI002584CE5C|nr:hypothetical protein [uncultured Victivallis sp.]